MNKIYKGLYLCGLNDINYNELEKIDIIVSIMQYKPKFDNIINSLNKNNIYYFAIDDEKFDISQYFDVFIELVKNNIDKNILVHCEAGASRSATLIASYLIYKNVNDSKIYSEIKKIWKIKERILIRSEIERIIDSMKKKRPIVEPNNGFLNQLILFRKKCILELSIDI